MRTLIIDYPHRGRQSLQMVIASVWDIDCDSQCVRFSVSGTQERVGLIDRGQRSSPDMFFANVIPVSTQSF